MSVSSGYVVKASDIDSLISNLEDAIESAGGDLFSNTKLYTSSGTFTAPKTGLAIVLLAPGGKGGNGGHVAIDCSTSYGNTNNLSQVRVAASMFYLIKLVIVKNSSYKIVIGSGGTGGSALSIYNPDRELNSTTSYYSDYNAGTAGGATSFGRFSTSTSAGNYFGSSYATTYYHYQSECSSSSDTSNNFAIDNFINYEDFVTRYSNGSDTVAASYDYGSGNNAKTFYVCSGLGGTGSMFGAGGAAGSSVITTRGGTAGSGSTPSSTAYGASGGNGGSITGVMLSATATYTLTSGAGGNGIQGCVKIWY